MSKFVKWEVAMSKIYLRTLPDEACSMLQSNREHYTSDICTLCHLLRIRNIVDDFFWTFLFCPIFSEKYGIQWILRLCEIKDFYIMVYNTDSCLEDFHITL